MKKNKINYDGIARVLADHHQKKLIVKDLIIQLSGNAIDLKKSNFTEIKKRLNDSLSEENLKLEVLPRVGYVLCELNEVFDLEKAMEQYANQNTKIDEVHELKDNENKLVRMHAQESDSTMSQVKPHEHNEQKSDLPVNEVLKKVMKKIAVDPVSHNHFNEILKTFGVECKLVPKFSLIER